jgi:hypothetical protein
MLDAYAILNALSLVAHGCQDGERNCRRLLLDLFQSGAVLVLVLFREQVDPGDPMSPVTL